VDGSNYTGITRRSVEERVSEHAQGLIAGYAFTRRPVKLVFSEHYERINEAVAAERRIKGWSRAKKEAYMRGDFARLVALATRGSKRGG
jgi:putative endonuclease